MKWKILDTGKKTAEKNMAIDAELLRELATEQLPVLHFYQWDGLSATYGHFLDPYKYLNKDVVSKQGIQLARRPTGGGIVFHFSDFTYSVLIPATFPQYSDNTLENYAFIHRTVAKALQKYLGVLETPSLLEEEPHLLHPHAKHFCMAGPVRNDVMLLGKKVGGGAQRRTRHGYLHQGTISCPGSEESFFNELFYDQEIKDLVFTAWPGFSLNQEFKAVLASEFEKSALI